MWAGREISGTRGPQALLLHDVPKLTQIRLGDGVVWFQLKSPEVIGFGFLQFPVEVEYRSEVHQSCRVLKQKQMTILGSDQLSLKYLAGVQQLLIT